jgi:hypothetical protein
LATVEQPFQVEIESAELVVTGFETCQTAVEIGVGLFVPVKSDLFRQIDESAVRAGGDSCRRYRGQPTVKGRQGAYRDLKAGPGAEVAIELRLHFSQGNGNLKF